jgi:hypothetical protein
MIRVSALVARAVLAVTGTLCDPNQPNNRRSRRAITVVTRSVRLDVKPKSGTTGRLRPVVPKKSLRSAERSEADHNRRRSSNGSKQRTNGSHKTPKASSRENHANLSACAQVCKKISNTAAYEVRRRLQKREPTMPACAPASNPSLPRRRRMIRVSALVARTTLAVSGTLGIPHTQIIEEVATRRRSSGAPCA